MTTQVQLQSAVIRSAAWATAPLHHRGLHRVAWAVGRAFPSGNSVVKQLPQGKLTVFLNDGYWIRLLVPGWRYEPDVEATLDRLLKDDSYFVDGGANIGYWSMVASASLRPDSVVAVEASPSTFRQLRANAELNGGRWRAVHAALWSSVGQEITMYSAQDHHASGTVIDRLSPPGAIASVVRTTTIDELVEQYAGDSSRSVVVKLDVEGAEIEALRGASRTLAQRDAYVIYEEHGKDRSHAVSRFILEQGALKTFFISDDGALTRVLSVDVLDDLKVSRAKGYNMLTCRLDAQISESAVRRSP